MTHRAAGPVDWSWKTERRWLWRTQTKRVSKTGHPGGEGRRKIQDCALGLDSPQDFLVKSSAPTSHLGSSVTLASRRQCSPFLAWPITHAMEATRGKPLTLHLQCAATLGWCCCLSPSSSSPPLLLPSLPLLRHSTEGPSVPRELVLSGCKNLLTTYGLLAAFPGYPTVPPWKTVVRLSLSERRIALFSFTLYRRP